MKKPETESIRLENLLIYEKQCMENGYHLIAGVDEAGRGPLAGPVVAAAVILPPLCKIEGVNDSKKLSPKKRRFLYDEIKNKALCVSVGVCDNELIDRINILQAALCAMGNAVKGLPAKPDFVLVDGNKSIPGLNIPQLPVVNADGKSMSVAAASIIAKVTRDNIMEDYESAYPAYGFAKHKGYGTKEHITVLRQKGPCPIHRASFIKEIIL